MKSQKKTSKIPGWCDHICVIDNVGYIFRWHVLFLNVVIAGGLCMGLFSMASICDHFGSGRFYVSLVLVLARFAVWQIISRSLI